jgi:UPF0755 protein
LVGLACSGWFWFAWQRDRPGPLPVARAIVVPHGSAERIAQVLSDASAIGDPRVFRLSAWLGRHEGALHAGEFAFPAHASMADILLLLRTAKPVVHRLTIPEGLTAPRVAAIFAKAEAAMGETGPIGEGTLLPGTYSYEYGAAREGLAAKAREAMAKALAAAWADKAPDLPLSGPNEALILASIVEKETARADERAHVAAVYLNRLRIGMKLQADPTVVFMASNGAGQLDHPITRSELDRDDPYNTYRVAGLPPGPICAPGAASIQAVLHPIASQDLFFVADGTGGHVFAATREAHERNVAKWRASKPHG